jgi:hypothetical protein
MSMDRVFKSESKAFISPPAVLGKFLEAAVHAEDGLYKMMGEGGTDDVRDRCKRLFGGDFDDLAISIVE